MIGLYKNKYRIGSTRLSNYDYSQNGVYFITICVKDRKHYFGEVVGDPKNARMRFSEMGKIAQNFWLEIPKHFDSVDLQEFIVMPNHIHGFIEITANRKDEAMPRLYNGQYPKMSEISPKARSLSVIIGSFKSVFSKTINLKYPNNTFHWQPRFYDHVIRNEKALFKIQEYITENPRL